MKKSKIQELIDKNLADLKTNSEAIEAAVQKLISEQEMKVTEAEYKELSTLTSILDEIDSVLLQVCEEKKKKKVPPKKKKTNKSKKAQPKKKLTPEEQKERQKQLRAEQSRKEKLAARRANIDKKRRLF